MRSTLARNVLPLFLLASTSSAVQPASAAPPNVVFILADDLGVNDLGCQGRRDHATPELDRLAREGARFTQAYCSQPICSPTRAAILTGKAPARLHLTTYLPGRPDAPSQLLRHPVIRQELPLEETTLAERLRTAGYATACIGKWHLGGQGFLPTDQGFDVYFPGRAATEPSAEEGGKGEMELARAAERFIEEHREKPFFLYLAHNSPHVPLAARAELVARHRDAYNPTYAAMLETLDASVGVLLRKIDLLGLAERTLVVFTSDNGGLHVLEGNHTPSTHNSPYRAGKGYCYEGGLRVPAIVRWTGTIRSGITLDPPAVSTDWVPTLLELAGLPSPGTPDGTSLAGLLLRGEPLPARPLFWHFPHYTNQGGRPSGAVRDGSWKLIEHYEDGRLELYDLARNRAETEDLSAKEPGRVAELRGKLEAWRRSVDAQRNTGNADYDAGLWRPIYADADPSRLAPGASAAALAVQLETWRAQMDRAVAVREGQPVSRPGRGAILLEARDAKAHGTKLRYEPEPHKDTLGYWVDAGDWAEWSFEAAKAGAFEVVMLQGCGAGSGGSEVEVTLGGQSLRMTVEETGHFQRFVPRTIGVVRIAAPGAHTLSVRAVKKPGAAVMDLRRVILRAAPDS